MATSVRSALAQLQVVCEVTSAAKIASLLAQPVGSSATGSTQSCPVAPNLHLAHERQQGQSPEHLRDRRGVEGQKGAAGLLRFFAPLAVAQQPAFGDAHQNVQIGRVQHHASRSGQSGAPDAQVVQKVGPSGKKGDSRREPRTCPSRARSQQVGDENLQKFRSN